MDDPAPVEGWPDRPLTESEAADLCDGEVRAVHVMDHDDAVRASLGAEDGDVVEVVLETDDEYRMYSYAAAPGDESAAWQDYGRQSRAGDGDEAMRGTLASYRVLAGESTYDDG